MKNIFVVFFFLLMILGVNHPLISNSSYIAERGGGVRGGMGHDDFNRDNFNRDDANRNDLNRGDLNRGDVNSFNAGAAVGADRGAAYGAAAATGAGSVIPGDPDAVEQDMLYYSGAQNLNQGH